MDCKKKKKKIYDLIQKKINLKEIEAKTFNFYNLIQVFYGSNSKKDRKNMVEVNELTLFGKNIFLKEKNVKLD